MGGLCSLLYPLILISCLQGSGDDHVWTEGPVANQGDPTVIFLLVLPKDLLIGTKFISSVKHCTQVDLKITE